MESQPQLPEAVVKRTFWSVVRLLIHQSHHYLDQALVNFSRSLEEWEAVRHPQMPIGKNPFAKLRYTFAWTMSMFIRINRLP